MKRGTLRMVLAPLAALVLLIGCDAALTVGSKTVGVRSGHFIFTDGYLRSTYNAPFDVVWPAAEKTLLELKAKDIEKKREIATGAMKAVVQDENVVVQIEYVEKNSTAVGVRVGMAGNNLASELIHERLGKRISEALAPETQDSAPQEK